MTTSGEDLRRLAADTFGWSRLRAEQIEAMEHVVAGRDVLVVLPTGAGKSAIYQVPALVLDGPTVVVSPLIALQHDQVESIGDSRAPEAVAVNSAQPDGERQAAWQALRRGAAQYVFLSPEQLADEGRVARLAGLGVSLLVVDEAHCVSSWGHDFRPDYLRLGSVVERLGRPTVLALTATAAPPVRRDIVARLGLREHREVVASFDRPELHLAVERFSDDAAKRAAVVGRVRERDGCGLVYVASRKDTEYYAAELGAAGVRVAGYHAGMKAADRERAHQAFLDGDVDVVVATSAFGMGIDKPDVRFVLHASVPDSLDSYYQQIGRAGRDGDPAAAVLFYRPEDLHLQRFLTSGKAPEDTLGAVVGSLHEHDGPVPRATLAREVDAPPARRTRAVNLLEEVGAVVEDERGRLAVNRDVTAAEAVEQAVEAEQAHRRLVRSRVAMLRAYAETTGCRRQHLLGYFGEQLSEPCGNCDTCDSGTAARRVPGTSAFALDSRVGHPLWGTGVVMSIEEDRMTVLFDAVGYKTLSLRAVQENNLLSKGA
ncbi:RecQ family ATP-dependent DNA helicase [Actinosynnema sp. NPDC047251]|uniref:ATP-dependent DNA helicase RecQ n=1 Tax=Saccharothrix espanaensis (strain ATCC 51144 / DSM 44229 / JCM 9112 / NBRC 15066 / NRRL 15764) TaxID=1179773 RepID=K0K5J7_SACES|nr:RecQ family ATP-dependent DNA helicase [Saccharothrix espanaensis]CCH31833.1 ATP-dependent DNA helicase RecQ [Saccharothrix espanaensis DSM 44229]